MKKKGLQKGKDAGFKVPDNYFGNLEQRILQKIGAEEAQNLPKARAPFTVPDDYFSSFESRLKQRIRNENSQRRIIPLTHKKKLSYMAGVAAVIAVIFYSVVLDRTRSFSYSDLDMIAVENYLLESLEYTGSEAYIHEGDFSYSTSDQADLDREALLEYLQENIEEPALLLNDQ